MTALMYDRHPTRALVLGGGRPAVKLSLNGGLDASTWDSIFGPGAADISARKVGASSAASFTRQGWFRRCATLRGHALAAMPWALYDEGTQAGDYQAALMTSDTAAPDDLAPLASLPRLLFLSEASLALSGRMYIGKVLGGSARGRLGRLESLRYWSPYAVTPEWNNTMTFRREVNGRVFTVDPESVVYGWQPDPLVEMGPGSSDGDAAAHHAAVLDAMARFLGDHFDGGLVKMTVLSTRDGTRVQPEQATEASSAWWRFLTGRSRRQGPPVLNNIEPHVIGEGLKELANEVLTREQREAIATSFGIPWGKLMDNASNFATAQVQERSFLLDTVVPQSRVIADAFNAHLLREYGLELRFEPERSEVLQQFELEKAEKVASLVDLVYTREEARELMGKPPEPTSGEFRDRQPAPAMRSLGEGFEARVASIIGEGA